MVAAVKIASLVTRQPSISLFIKFGLPLFGSGPCFAWTTTGALAGVWGPPEALAQPLARRGSKGAAPGRAGVEGRSPWQGRGTGAQPLAGQESGGAALGRAGGSAPGMAGVRGRSPWQGRGQRAQPLAEQGSTGAACGTLLNFSPLVEICKISCQISTSYA